MCVVVVSILCEWCVCRVCVCVMNVCVCGILERAVTKKSGELCTPSALCKLPAYMGKMLLCVLLSFEET